MSASRCMACSSNHHRTIAGMTMLRDAGMHVAYPGRITYYFNWGAWMRDDHWSLVAPEARSGLQNRFAALLSTSATSIGALP
jgi:hypothetical protein